MLSSGGIFTSLWVASQWPGIAAAAHHAEQLPVDLTPAHFEFFSAADGADVDALCAQIVPSGATPGAVYSAGGTLTLAADNVDQGGVVKAPQGTLDIDAGKTLTLVSKLIQKLGPASMKVCVLLDKKGRREVPFQADFVGFDIPDKFVVGYGLDFAERYRNLPCIGVLKPELQNPPEWA